MADFRCWILAAIGTTACGCAALRSDHGVRGSLPANGPTAAIAAAPSGSFAELPRVPGERILRHPPIEAVPAVSERSEPPMLPATLPTATALPALPTDPPLIAALRAYLNDKPEAGLEALNGMERTNRDLLAQVLPAAVNASRMNFAKAGPSDIGVLATQLETPVLSLTPRMPLSLTKTLLCTAVEGFGRYRAVPKDTPMRPGELIHVYAELRNVPCLPIDADTPRERWLTDLRTSLKLRDGTGAPVPLLQSNGEYGPARNERRREETESPIRDYFVAFRFTVPAKPGGYTVHVEIHDPAGGRYVSEFMPLRVGG